MSRQRKTVNLRHIYDYMDNYRHDNGYLPSFREIQDWFGISSISTVHRLVKDMVRLGYVGHGFHLKRAITLLHRPPAGHMRLNKKGELVEHTR